MQQDIDNITAEILGRSDHQKKLKLFNKILEAETIPHNWNQSIPIFESGDIITTEL